MFQSIFQSVTLKLTAWYLIILMSISLVFSVAIYQINFHEVNVRLENLQNGLVKLDLVTDQPSTVEDRLRLDQSRQAGLQMLLALIYVNAGILVFGGICSYWLARRTLAPLEKAHDAQSRFTSDASHELRTPLAAMKAEIEASLRDPNLTTVESRELLESNLEEVNKLISLSEMLLKLARLDYDRVEKEKVDIIPLVKAAMKPFSAHKKRFKVTTRKKAVAYGNEAAITELATILIDNAVKYSPPSSAINIRIFERRLMIGVEVKNEGKKISRDQLDKLFERFYRADSSRTASHTNGYGLGLAIAKKIVDIHHGSLQVTSNDKHTAVTFFLPTYRAIASPVPEIRTT